LKKSGYEKAIVRLLEGASQPLDVERIRVECRIGNWQTALKHCLELLYHGKICGVKTSKSWIFWSNAARHNPLSIKLAGLFRGDSDDQQR